VISVIIGVDRVPICIEAGPWDVLIAIVGVAGGWLIVVRILIRLRILIVVVAAIVSERVDNLVTWVKCDLSRRVVGVFVANRECCVKGPPSWGNIGAHVCY